MKRSKFIAGHKTSMGLEDAFGICSRKLLPRKETPVRQLVNRIDSDREHANLSSAIRLFVLDHYRWLANEAAPGGKAKRP